MKRNLRLLVSGAALLWLTACDLPTSPEDLGALPSLVKPGVTAGDVSLLSAPGFWDLAAYYCPMIADSDLVRLSCTAALGQPPKKDLLGFRFRLPVEIANPNSFPLPVSELLTVLTLFPKDEDISLAAICMSMCQDEASDCGASPGNCASDEPEISGAEDLAAAAFSYLQEVLLTGASGEALPLISLPHIDAESSDTLNVTLELGIDAVQKALKSAFSGNLSKILASQDFSVSIPVQIDGSMWFVAEHFGRFGASYGPTETTWTPK